MDGIEQRLLEAGCEGAAYFTGDNYESAILGTTIDSRVVYSYELMCEWLMKNDKITYEEAVEWIDYNVIRAIPYMGSKSPIIVYELP